MVPPIVIRKGSKCMHVEDELFWFDGVRTEPKLELLQEEFHLPGDMAPKEAASQMSAGS